MKRWRTVVVAGGVALAATGGVAWAATRAPAVVHSCYKKAGGALRITGGGACKRSEKALSWNITGPAGPAGPAGAAGPAGPAGPSGAGASLHLVIRTFTQSVSPNGSATFTARCNTGEVATGGGWRYEGALPSGNPPVTVLGTEPQSSAAEPSAGDTPIAWKVVGAANHDNVAHNVTAFAVCAST